MNDTICPKSGLRKATAQTMIDWRNAQAKPRTQPTPSALDLAGGKVSDTQHSRKHKDAVLYKRTDGRRQSWDKQIADLKAEMQKDRMRIIGLLQRNKLDDAMNRMAWMLQRRDRIKDLAAKALEERSPVAKKTRTVVDPKLGKVTIGKEADTPIASKHRVERKVKRYKIFSET